MNNLNLIIGEDKQLIDYYLQDILKKINYNDEDKITYDMSISTLSDILDEASMISLFSSIKVIIGNNFDISRINDNEFEYLTKYTLNINKDCYIVLIASKVDGRSKYYKLIKDKFNIIDTSKSNNKDELLNYIKNKINENKYKIDYYNIEYLLNKVGNDINNINLELDKLFIYKENDKIINKEDIDLLIIDNIDNIIYEFTNAFIDKNMDKVIKMYHDFKKQNIGADYLISSLSNVLRQVLIIKILSNNGKSNLEISKVIGKKEFYVKKMIERLYQYTEKDICNLITNLSKVDLELKNGESNIDSLEFYLLNN